MTSQPNVNWDLSHLSSKYPWLQVNESTLEEFREPFDWSKQKAPRKRKAIQSIPSKPTRTQATQHEENMRSSSSSSLSSSRQQSRIDAGRAIVLTHARDTITDAVLLKSSQVIPLDNSTSPVIHSHSSIVPAPATSISWTASTSISKTKLKSPRKQKQQRVFASPSYRHHPQKYVDLCRNYRYQARMVFSFPFLSDCKQFLV